MPKGVLSSIISWVFQHFFVISQILSSMLDINVYSIIVSKIFGVIVGDNFLSTIVVERFYNCKHVIEKKCYK
jgi:cytosine/uracil/thiamine/allantoin permease